MRFFFKLEINAYNKSRDKGTAEIILQSKFTKLIPFKILGA